MSEDKLTKEQILEVLNKVVEVLPQADLKYLLSVLQQCKKDPKWAKKLYKLTPENPDVFKDTLLAVVPAAFMHPGKTITTLLAMLGFAFLFAFIMLNRFQVKWNGVNALQRSAPSILDVRLNGK